MVVEADGGGLNSGYRLMPDGISDDYHKGEYGDDGGDGLKGE